jgi:uncharacterized membrane protein
MKQVIELLFVSFAIMAVTLIIWFVHILVEKVNPGQRITNMIPWLETLLVITVVASFVGREVKSFILFIFKLLSSKTVETNNIEEPRNDIWGYLSLIVVIGLSAWIYTLLIT